MSSPLTFQLCGGVKAHVEPLDACMARLHFTKDGAPVPPPDTIVVRTSEGIAKPFRDSYLLAWLYRYEVIDSSDGVIYTLERFRQVVMSFVT